VIDKRWVGDSQPQSLLQEMGSPQFLEELITIKKKVIHTQLEITKF